MSNNEQMQIEMVSKALRESSIRRHEERERVLPFEFHVIPHLKNYIYFRLVLITYFQTEVYGDCELTIEKAEAFLYSYGIDYRLIDLMKEPTQRQTFSQCCRTSVSKFLHQTLIFINYRSFQNFLSSKVFA